MLLCLKRVWNFRVFQFFIFIIMASCLDEKRAVEKPLASTLTLQLHNFNADPSTGVISDGSLPDIFYFKQNADDTYSFTLSARGGSLDGINGAEQFMFGKLDKSGLLIDNLMPREFLPGLVTIYDFGGILENLSTNTKPLQNPRRYFVRDNKLHYAKGDYLDELYETFLWRLISLDPNTGESTVFKAFECNYFDLNELIFTCSDELDGIFPTSDNGFIVTASTEYANEIRKFSSVGTLEFSHRSWEPPNSSWGDVNNYPSLGLFLGDKGGDYYYLKTNPQTLHYSIFSDAHYLRFIMPLVDEVDLVSAGEFTATFNIELRLGPGKSQLAHRFTLPTPNVGSVDDTDYSYKDYVNIPFEVWDITNNRQLMASFRDVDQDGTFDFRTESPYEFIFIHDYTYSETQHPSIALPAGHAINRVTLLKGGFNSKQPPEDILNYRDAVFRLTREQSWSSVILKVNSTGITRLKTNVINVAPEYGKLHKAVPYKNGYAVLVNAMTNEPAKLVLLDADFNQTDILDIVKEGREGTYLMETDGNSIFVASGDRTINLTVYRDGVKIERNLSDFINTDKIKLELFTITPTNSGGVAVLAWVKQSINTRDLLFIEFDENLKIVK